MAMKRCPICGEKYSETYKKCPFCEEEEALQSGGRIQRGGHRAGKRAASRGQQPNLLSPILVVLIIIMAVLLVYLLFGDKIQDKLAGEGDTSQQTEEITPVEPDITDEGETEGVMPDDEDPSGQTDSQTGEEDTDQETTTTPSDVDSLPETLTMSYLGTPKTEFTMSVGDAPIPLTASGGNGKYTWSSSDDGIASVDSTGRVTAISSDLQQFGRLKGITVVALSQLSRPERDAKSRKIRPPVLSDLRASGQIEMDADVVMFIYREDYDDKDSKRILKIAKNKEGEALDWVRFRFDGDLQTFTRIAPQQDELPVKKERQAPRQVSFWPEHPDPNNPWKEGRP